MPVWAKEARHRGNQEAKGFLDLDGAAGFARGASNDPHGAEDLY